MAALVLFLVVSGLSWPLLGCSWAALRRSWGSLGALLAALGRSWETLGGLLAALGTLLAALGAILERHAKIIQKSIPKITDLGSKTGAQKKPKSDPNELKSKTKIDAKKKDLQDRLEAVLGRSCVVLLPPVGSFLLMFY